MEKDPIPGYRKVLIDEGTINGEDDKKIEAEVLEELRAAVKFAEESPFPDVSRVEEDVYA
jgi:TPP-dependent pyruvate/acetoin dehydrogenase alpha subunit